MMRLWEDTLSTRELHMIDTTFWMNSRQWIPPNSEVKLGKRMTTYRQASLPSFRDSSKQDQDLGRGATLRSLFLFVLVENIGVRPKNEEAVLGCVGLESEEETFTLPESTPFRADSSFTWTKKPSRFLDLASLRDMKLVPIKIVNKDGKSYIQKNNKALGKLRREIECAKRALSIHHQLASKTICSDDLVVISPDVGGVARAHAFSYCCVKGVFRHQTLEGAKRIIDIGIIQLAQPP
ncbi:hypothetical protein VNO77_31261 [Canavalia gladiata]|uniref:Uncharacterized protein n=1 Tax=Canavalia gladiata TaxID=3824 RepID=A0AAN9Q3M0_CANGL